MSHRRAVQSAVRMNREMGVLFKQLGGVRYPRGAVMVAYRRALRELRDILASGGAGPAWTSVRVAEAGEVLRRLRLELALAIAGVLDEAAALGEREALAQLAGYATRDASPSLSMTRPSLSTTAAETARAEGLAAVMAVVDAQVAASSALLVTGARPEQIVGTDERQGSLAPAAVLSLAWFWVGVTTLAAWGAVAQRPGGGQVFFKQAVAAIDERTTDCCLRVHGQVVPLDGEFHLTGRPRFAEYMAASPFHWSCRTALALVRPEDAEDQLTAEMVNAARIELAARERTGRRRVIHPAHARSRRR